MTGITTTELVERTIPLSKRLHRSKYFKEHYAGSVPVYIQYGNTGVLHRYIVPGENNFGHLLVAFRRKTVLKPSEALMSLIEVPGDEIKSVQATTNSTMNELAERHLHPDGFLYVNIVAENVFG